MIDMRAAVLFEQGKPKPYVQSKPLSIETVQLAPPGDDEVLVRVRASGLCHSDLSMMEGVRPKALPIVVGHECAGEVVETGANVTEARVGDHVVMSFVATCGTCRACSRGRPNLCDSHWAARNSGGLMSGERRLFLDGQPLNHHSGVSAFAEYAVVSRYSVVPVDKNMDFFDAALFGCGVMTGVGAVTNTARLTPGESAAVLGLGGVGLSALLGAVASSAGQIVAIDLNQSKLDAALELGATHAIRADDESVIEQVHDITGGGVDWAFEMAGSVKAMELGYALLGRGGSVVSAGLSHFEHYFSVPHAAMVSDEKSVRGSYMGSCAPRRDIPRFVDLFQSGRLPVDRLRTATLGFDGLNEGFDALDTGKAIRQVLDPTRP